MKRHPNGLMELRGLSAWTKSTRKPNKLPNFKTDLGDDLGLESVQLYNVNSGPNAPEVASSLPVFFSLFLSFPSESTKPVEIVARFRRA